ncbi:hypothetical protein [Leptothermofonsia sp. ETS-13]|uniref:hypothetical protein n=1 Tax=Leptothermofonsia sp. ETS-13 TaxID=3035696 RepID=UPI003BA3AB79
MFPFWNNPCWMGEPMSRKAYQERKLRFLRWMRDDLETRLAGLNAAIETIERQINQDDDSPASV